MPTSVRRAALAVTLSAIAASTVLAPSAFAHDGRALTAIGLTLDGRSLVTFRTTDPTDAEQIGLTTGFPTPPPIGPRDDSRLVGIDYRVQNGRLYGLGNRGGIFTIDEGTAVVTEVGNLSVALSGTFFGIDFNPAANALRVVSDTGQNLRQPFGAGDAPTGATIVDTPLNKDDPPVAATGVSGAAYTNNDLDAASATQLFDIDTTDDRVVLQDPPNTGTLTGVGAVDSLGELDPNTSGFDIFSTVENGTTVDNDAFAIVIRDHDLLLLAIDLSTGDHEARGAFERRVIDLAIKLDQ